MITASLVLYNNKIEECKRVLNCLLNSPIDKIYLIDHSPNNILSCLKKYSERIEYMWHINTGYGAGHNLAIHHAVEIGSKYHLISNVDIFFDKDVIPALIDYMEIHEDVGLIMPKVFYPNGELQKLCKRLPTPWDLICKRFLPPKLAKKQVEKLCLQHFDYNSLLNVPWLSGCFLMCRSVILERIHGFDERFFMYAEDIDFSRRCHMISRTVYNPNIQIVHDHKASSYHSIKMLIAHITSVMKYFFKWGFIFDTERKRENERLDMELQSLH